MIKTVPLYGEAYGSLDSLKAAKTHLVELDETGSLVNKFCKVKEEHLMYDDSSQHSEEIPTCSKCAKAWAKAVLSKQL